MQQIFQEIQETARLWCLQSGVHCDLSVTNVEETGEKNWKRRVLIYQKENPDGRQTLEIDLQKPLVNCSFLEYKLT